MDINLIASLTALLFTGGIFLIAFLAFLLRGVNAMLDAKTEPLKENQVLLKENQVRLEKELAEFKKEVNGKLDKLVSHILLLKDKI